MKAIIYARTSRDDEQGDDKSLPDQVQDCTKLAQDSGYEVLEIVKEANRSGRLYPSDCPVASMDAAVLEYSKDWPKTTRDGLARVIKRLPEIQIVIARDMQRIARPLSDSMLGNWLQQQFKKHGIKLHTCHEGLKDPSEWQTQFLQTITSMSVDNEIQKRKQFSKAKLDKLVDEGKVNHGPTMFGYQSAGKQNVQVVQDEAKIVNFVFEFAAQGESWLAITKKLNTQHPIKKWNIREVLKIIDRPQYFGYSRNKAGQLIKSVVFPAVVKKHGIEVWKTLQAKRKTNRERHGRHHYKAKHPLSGLLKCGFCGSNLVISRAKEFGSDKIVHYYICSHSYQVTPTEQNLGCRKARIAEENILQFFNSLTGVFIANEYKNFKDDSEVQKERAELEKKRSALETKENNIVDSASIGSEFVKRQLSRIQEQLTEVNGKLAELATMPVRPKFANNASDNAILGIMDAKLNLDRQQEIFQASIEWIKVYMFKVEFKLKGEDKIIDVERICDRFRRVLPAPIVVGTADGSTYGIVLPYKSTWKRKVQSVMRADGSFSITFDTKGTEDRTERVLFKNDVVKIVTVGTNPAYGEYATKVKKRALANALPEYVLTSRPWG
jgi:DNA invertase Pin-like site-specific DNA recombinase